MIKIIESESLSNLMKSVLSRRFQVHISALHLLLQLFVLFSLRLEVLLTFCAHYFGVEVSNHLFLAILK